MKRIHFSPVLHLNHCPDVPRRKLGEYARHFFGELGSLMEEGLLEQVTIYCSGPFLEAALSKSGSLLSGLRKKIREGRIEFLGGGYFDPVFPLIPQKLQDLQIRRLSDSLGQYLDTTPRGFWLPSFIWENSMVDLLSRHGFEYIVLRDYQLKDSLSRYTRRQGYWIIEDRGRLVKVVAASDDFSAMFRGGDIQHMIEFMELGTGSLEDIILDIPFFRSRRGVYEKDWLVLLRRFLAALDGSGLAVRQRTVGARMNERRSGGSINLPTSVGRSLGLDESLKSCRDALIIQPEYNFIHKKMIHLFRRISRLEDKGERAELEQQLLPAQAVFYMRGEEGIGGLRYLEDRAECLSFLLEAERRLDRMEKSRGVRLEVTDFLANGTRQLLCGNRKLGFHLEHCRGGRLRSLEYKPLRLNLINGYRESNKVAAAEHVFSVSPVSGLKDRLLPGELDLDETLSLFEGREGLLDGPYEYRFRKQKDKSQVILSGEQNAEIRRKRHSFRVEKALSLKNSASELVVGYQLVNATFQAFQGAFATEMNFSFRDFDPEHQQLRIGKAVKNAFREAEQHFDVKEVELRDRSLGLAVSWEFLKPCTLVTVPVYTGRQYQPESRKFQYLRMIASWKLGVAGQESWAVTSRIVIRRPRMGLG